MHFAFHLFEGSDLVAIFGQATDVPFALFIPQVSFTRFAYTIGHRLVLVGCRFIIAIA
ncbi:Uncharacterised protein [Vibrio cholerae]|uniref:Uncharacterized protein n=1 Tax=Vibrio cholerae TaxID=666 RepID=A0A655XDE9_VIBCL|nr:Uncharacterised protein [Vibrio cholerae]CRZ94504.1 Uncharacterised protein [Vibrio cholerae]CSA11212.1 Uncharacterised protein [Vibrio cholerae]CSA11889.1 Uncharacterised protein [Vibrio cholerae]CSA22891.1 Uncharacterised protein [Vibrio cholerae]